MTPAQVADLSLAQIREMSAAVARDRAARSLIEMEAQRAAMASCWSEGGQALVEEMREMLREQIKIKK